MMGVNDKSLEIKKGRYAGYILFAFFLLLTIIGDYKTIFYGADIDESYALTMAMRLVKGDRLLLEMWEPHQLSALIYAPLVWIYSLFSGKYAEGLVIFLRMIGCVIQFIIGMAFYRLLLKRAKPAAAMTAAFVYINFTPKQIQAPEFTIIFYWAMTILLILMQYRYEADIENICGSADEKKGINRSFESDRKNAGAGKPEEGIRSRVLCSIFTGLCLSVMVLCYPSAILVFAYMILLMCFFGDRRSALITAGVCLISACLLFVYMAAGGDIAGRLSNVTNVLMDEAHSQPVAAKLLGNLKDMIVMLTVTGGIMVVTLSGRRILGKKKGTEGILLAILFFLQGVWMAVQFHSFNGVNYQELLPVILQLTLIGICFFDRGSASLWAVVPVLSTICVMMMSNVITRASMGFLLPSALYGIVILSEKIKDNKPAVWMLALMTAVLVVQVFGVRLILVRFSGNQRRNIFEEYYTENKGAAAGLRLSADDWQHVEMLDELYIKYLMDGSSVLYMGSDMYLYSLLDAEQIGTGNTLSTPGFGEQILRWYDENPERIPDYIFVEHGYMGDFGESLYSGPFSAFVNANYDIAGGWDEGTVSIYRRLSVKGDEL